jgi:hypothetical protein
MSKFKLGVLIGVASGLAVAGLVAIVLLRDPIAPLTRTAYEKARARWRDKEPQNYDMHVKITGGQVGEMDVEVRGGNVTRLLRDGQPLANRGTTWRNWSVPGMFDILASDLARLEDPTSNAVDYKISAEFDAEWGYPARYRQIQLGGARQTSEWHVTRFANRADE